MARFTFRLERVLDLARLREDMARAVLMACVQDTRRAEAHVDQSRARVALAEQSLAQLMAPGTVNAFDLMMGLDEIGHRRRALSAAQAQWHAAKQVELEKNQIYRAARSRREALEKLRERKLGEWQDRQARDELKLIDEAASRRHQRRS
ncbi:MAG: flagellar export protein FliJ [Planctomycetota bacterium]